MKDRILQFLTSEKISPAEFADKIGVQRSSMSHILNGRNYPSASFIQKMLQAYPLVNSRWLMIGEGQMNIGMHDKEEISIAGLSYDLTNHMVQSNDIYCESGTHSIPGNEMASGGLTNNMIDADQTTYAREVINAPQNGPVNSIDSQILKEEEEVSQRSQGSNQPPSFPIVQSGEKDIEQILFFYKDKTFMVYRPS